MNSRKLYMLSMVLVIVSLVLSACGAPTPVPTVVPTQVPSIVAPTHAPTQVPPTPAPTSVPPTAESTQAPAAAAKVEPLYMPRNVQAAYDNGTRSLDGKPGPKYWQNKAEHNISLTVAPPSLTISATEDITYTNNSPDYLSTLPVRLYLNVRQPEAQREETKTADFLNAGVQIDEFRINGVVVPWSPLPGSPLTAPTIGLPLPLAPGESVQLSFKWHFDLSPAYKHEGAFDPTSFFIGYFFPRITPYNDTDLVSALPGFDTEDFTYRSGREQFNDFADFTVSVNVPKNFVVWATGDLQNPDEVLQPTYAQRLKDSLTSDQIVNIAQPEEVQQGKVTAQTDSVTWRWQAENVPDFAIGLSDHYVWDAGSVIVDPATNRRASVQAAYPATAADYKSMVQTGKDVLTFSSTQWPGVPYPYSKTTVFVGGGDEEFPMMANDGPEPPPLPGATVRFIASHEILHSYFPFYMGIDERRYPLFDEGWTTVFEYLFGLEDVGKEQADTIFKAARSSNIVAPISGIDIPIITPADSTRGRVTSSNAYEKPALAYLALKDLLGDEAFKAALQEFMARWHGKHPLPWDMFNTFNAISPEDLTWFFNNWFFESHFVDLAAAGLDKTNDGYAVQVKNAGGFAIPFDVQAVYADGTTELFHQTPRIWKDSTEAVTVTLPVTREVKAVLLDSGIFNDVNAANNSWPAGPAQDPNAPVIAQAKNDTGTAALTMTLLPKSKQSGPGQYGMPSGVTVVLSVLPASKTPEEAIKDNATNFKVKFTDSDIVAAEPIAGYPSKVLRSSVNLGGAEYGYDSYAFTTPAATYQIILLLPYLPAVETMRKTTYPDLLKTVVVDPN